MIMIVCAITTITKDFGGSDSSRFLLVRGRLPRSIGNRPYNNHRNC